MKLGSATYSAAGAARVTMIGFDAATTATAATLGQGDDFAHALTIGNTVLHAGSFVTNGIRGWNEAVRYSDKNKPEAKRHGLIAFGEAITAGGYGMAAAGLGWPTLVVAGVGTIVSTFAQASTPDP